MRHTIIKTIYSKNIGLGHLNAMVFLTNRSPKNLTTFTFVINNEIDAIRYLKQHKKKILIDENFKMNDHLIDQNCDVAIYYFPLDQFFIKKKRHFKTIFISNSLKKVKSNADVVILGPDKQVEYKYKKNFYTGPKYSIFEHSNYKYKHQENIKNCLVCLGGTDKSDNIIKVIKALEYLNLKINYSFFLRSSMVSKDISILIKQNNNKTFKFIFDKKSLSSYLPSFHFGIISGGNILYQMCSSHIPTLVLPQSKEENLMAKRLQKQKCTIVSKSNFENWNQTTFCRQLMKYIYQNDRRKVVTQSCKKYFGNKNLNEVYKLIK